MPETIGQRLKKAREYRNLTLEKAEQATRIRAIYLQALEADDFSAIPSPVQARGFLRNYAEYLNLDLDEMVEELRESRSVLEEIEGVVFENEQEVVPSLHDDRDPDPAEGETESEPFWQTWLKRVKEESGQSIEEIVIEPDPEPEFTKQAETEDKPVSKEDEVAEKPPSGRELWQAFLNRAGIRVSRRQEKLPPAVDVQAKTKPLSNVVPPVQQTRSSVEIINEIGLQLRQRREMLSLSLDEIERHTRMRAQFLGALESGKFDDLPSPVQTRGMLSNYATFLVLDPDDLLLQFAEALQARHRERHPEGVVRKRTQPVIPSSIPTLRSFIVGDIAFGFGVVILLVVFSVWGGSRVISVQNTQNIDVQVEATGLSISEALIGTPVEEVEAEITLIAAEDTPIPGLAEGTVAVPTPNFSVNVQVNVVAVERTFMRVFVDGEETFNGRTIPGNAYLYEAEQSVELLVGNGAAVRVIYNQRDLGLLGGFGQVSSFIYTIDEIIVPTPIIPLTPTNTPYVSPTPSITPSPTATRESATNE